MVKIYSVLTYDKLLVLLSECMCIDLQQNTIHIFMKLGNYLNQMAIDIEDDDNIACIVTLTQKMT